MRNKRIRLLILSVYAALAGALITPAPTAAHPDLPTGPTTSHAPR